MNSVGLIVDYELVHVSQTNNNSGAMEKLGLKTVLDRLQKGLTIAVLATDRSTQVTSLMKKEYPTIKHQYDVWHYAKSITKKLAKIAKKKESDCLAQGIPSIANHIWWCAANSMGNSSSKRQVSIPSAAHCQQACMVMHGNSEEL